MNCILKWIKTHNELMKEKKKEKKPFFYKPGGYPDDVNHGLPWI